MSTEAPTQVLAHTSADADAPAVPQGGCVVYWTAATLKTVLAHAEESAAKDGEKGVKPYGGCIVYWW